MAEDLAWCAADPHFSREDPALPLFHRWLGAFAESGVPTLCLMGDLFQVWIGLPHAQTPEQRDVLAALARLTASGRRVVYLLGNRDYFVEEAASAAGVLSREQWDLRTPAGAVVRFEHGDLINTSDRAYLRWREISRANSVRGLFSLLPASRQVELAGLIEKRLSGTNLRYKDYRPDRELEAWARRLSAEGVSKVVLGHFHVDESVRAGGVEIRFLPQFREDGAYLVVGADGDLHPHRFAAPPA